MLTIDEEVEGKVQILQQPEVSEDVRYCVDAVVRHMHDTRASIACGSDPPLHEVLHSASPSHTDT